MYCMSTRTISQQQEYSGITPDHLEHGDKHLHDVRELADPIIVGHSLENDLNALGIVHSQVVDTALVFPGRIYNREWCGMV